MVGVGSYGARRGINVVRWPGTRQADETQGPALTHPRPTAAEICHEFRIVWDLAEAAKHRFLTTHLRSRIVTTSTGAWTDNNKTLEIIATGEQVDAIIGWAMEYWDKQI